MADILSTDVLYIGINIKIYVSKNNISLVFSQLELNAKRS